MTVTLEPSCGAKLQQPTQTCYAKPQVNIVENGNGYLIHADMPGVSKERIDVTVEEGQLTILGKRSPSNGEGSPLHRESRGTDYRRVFDLPDDIDTDAISATVNQGVLTVKLSKAERAKPRRIKVKG